MLRKPCRFFLAGRCAKGDACTFSHAADSGLVPEPEPEPEPGPEPEPVPVPEPVWTRLGSAPDRPSIAPDLDESFPVLMGGQPSAQPQQRVAGRRQDKQRSGAAVRSEQGEARLGLKQHGVDANFMTRLKDNAEAGQSTSRLKARKKEAQQRESPGMLSWTRIIRC